MKWAEITLNVLPDLVETASAVLTEAGCAGIVVHDPNAVSSDPFADWSTPPRDPDAPLDPTCRVSGYVPVDDRLEATVDAVHEGIDRAREWGMDLHEEITLRTVDDSSWAEAWKAYFKPLRVGSRFVVKPSWEPWDAAEGEVIIEIDPGMAFGSGAHATTRLCLLLLEEAVTPGARVLDWGTGSGILAIGAARLGAREIDAVDLDPVAVRVTQENVERNDLQAIIRTAEASIEAVAVEPPYDLVIANIVADPIIAGAPEIFRHLRPGGKAIVSGIIERREPEVTTALRHAGLELLRLEAEEDWRALLLQRP